MVTLLKSIDKTEQKHSMTKKKNVAVPFSLSPNRIQFSLINEMMKIQSLNGNLSKYSLLIFRSSFFCYWLVDMCSHKKCEGPNCPRTNEETSEELLSILSSGPIFAHILLRMTWISSLIFYYRPTKRPTAMVELRTTT